MANTKQIIIFGVVPDNFHDAFERTDAHAQTVRSWLARMNAPLFGLSITYEPPCVCGHSSNRHILHQPDPDADPRFVEMLAHLACEVCDCDHFAAAGRLTGGNAFYIGGTEAVSWLALEEFVAALKAVGATIERASALDLDSGEDTWKSFKDAA